MPLPPPSSPSPTTTSATPTQSTPAAINLIPEEYLGKQYNDVRSALIGLGLTVDGAEVFNDAAPGTVVDINPSGPVQPGDTITVSYSKGPETQDRKRYRYRRCSPEHSEKAVQKAIEDAGLRWAKGADVDPANGEEAWHVRQLRAPFRKQGARRLRRHLPPGQGPRRGTQPEPNGNVAHRAQFTPHPIAPGGPRPREHPARPQRAL